MKILAIADTHADSHYDAALRARIEGRERPQVLVHAGDWSDLGAREEEMLRTFQLAITVGVIVLYVKGSHEDQGRSVVREVVPGAMDLDEAVLTIEGVTLFGAEYVRRHGKRMVQKSQAFFSPLGDQKLVMVAHEPPLGWRDHGKTCGDIGVLDVIESVCPQVAICGHIHERGGKPMERMYGRTRVINPGPMGIEIAL